jgi:2-hydroxychromene-2-carboxylate isomerase
MSTVRVCFDFVSPYAYLGWTQLRRLGLTLEPVPILFGAVLDAHGTRGPAEVPARRRYLIHDVARLAHRLDAPLVLPPAHPFNPLPALRLASLPMRPDHRLALIDALFREAWATGRGLVGIEDIAKGFGLELEQTLSAEAKERVRNQTDGALRDGVFGVPTMFVDEQMFFGCDSLPHLEHYLQHGDVVAPGLVEQWEKLPASAVRPGAVSR